MSLTHILIYVDSLIILTFINKDKTRPADLVVEVIGERYSATAPLNFFKLLTCLKGTYFSFNVSCSCTVLNLHFLC